MSKKRRKTDEYYCRAESLVSPSTFLADMWLGRSLKGQTGGEGTEGDGSGSDGQDGGGRAAVAVGGGKAGP